MMLVYIVFYGYPETQARPESYTIDGVYATRGQAEIAAAKIERDRHLTAKVEEWDVTA